LTVSYIWPMVLGAAIWLPLGLWSLTGLARAAEKGGLARSLAIDLPLGAFAIALSVLGGHLEITFYSTFAIGLYGLYLGARLWVSRQRTASGRFILAAGMVVGLGVLVAAVQLGPFLEVLQTNNRQGDTTYRQVISYALPKRQILGLLMPDYFGNPAIHDYLDLTTLRSTTVERNARGDSIDNMFWGTKNYVESGGYVGVVPLILAAIGALQARPRERWFFLGLATLSLLLAFGSPLYALIYYGLPFFSQLRTPFRWLYLLDFAIAVLAGLGMDVVWGGVGNREYRMGTGDTPYPAAAGLSATRSDKSNRLPELPQDVGAGLSPLPAGEGQSEGRPPSPFSILNSLFPLALGLLGLVTLAASFVLRGRSIAYVDRYLARSSELQQAFASGAMLYSYEFRNLAIFFGLLAVGGLLIALLWSGHSGWDGDDGKTPSQQPSPKARGGNRGGAIVRPLLAMLLVATIVGDLFYFGSTFASKTPPSILDSRVDLTQLIPPDVAGPRVASLGDPYVLPANLGTILGVPTVGGYDTIISTGFVKLWSLVEAPVDLPFNQVGRLHRLDSLGSPILDLLGVRYVLAAVPADHPSVRLAGQVGSIRVYERPSALPRAFVVGTAQTVGSRDEAFHAMGQPGFQPSRVVVLEGAEGGENSGSGTAAIADYRLSGVTVTATVTGTAWLVVSDANAPGWSATVDGVAAPVLTADGIFRAVRLTSGSHQVAFRYLPFSLQYGAYGTFLGLIILAIIGTLPLWRRLTGHYAGQAERVLRNTTFPMLTSFLNKGIDFGFAVLMLRVIGATGIGQYTTAIVLMGYFEIFTNFGLNTLIIREVARNRAMSNQYLTNAIVLRLGLCAIAAPVAGAMFVFGGTWFNVGTPGLIAFALLTLSLIPGNITAALSALFTAWERNDLPASVTVVTTLARVTLGTAALLMGAGIVGLASIALAINIGLVVIFIVAARRALRVHLTRPVPADFPAMLTETYPLFMNHVLVTIFFKIDVVLLASLKGSESVGYYSAAYKWLDGFLIIPSTFTFAVYPALSRFADQKGEGLRAAYEVSIRVLVCLALPIAVIVAFLSGDLILILGGQAYYPQSALALTILIWFLPFSFINGLTQYALIAVNRQRFITVAFVVAAAFNLIANLIFIPAYGINATSAVTVLSEIVLMVPFLIAVRRSIGWPPWATTVGKPAMAGLLMVAVAYAGRAVEVHLGLIFASAVYVGALGVLGVFSTEELAVLRRLVQRRKVIPVPI
jgi:O-antigen/teichoic acid export membrane protein